MPRRALRVSLGLLVSACLLAAACWGPVFDGFAPAAIERGKPTARGPGDARPLVLVVSIDGLAPRYLARADAPTLARLARQGSAATEATTVVPSVTMTAHASMLSGVGPDTHGVRWNQYRPWRTVRAHTLYDVCEERALRCGLFAGKRKFAHFAEAEPGVERYAFGASAAEVLDEARGWARAPSPHFAMIHLAEVDLTGHAEGWGSDAQREQIEAIDALLGAFLAELGREADRPLSVIVTADHGGHGKTHGSDRPADVSVPWLAWGAGVPAGGMLGNVSVIDTAPTALALLGVPAPGAWTGRSRLPARADGGSEAGS